MLALKRKIGERIILRVGDEVIEIQIVNVQRDKTVKLGFEAAKHVAINRQEVDEANQREAQC